MVITTRAQPGDNYRYLFEFFCFNIYVERGRDVGYVKHKIAKKGKEFVDLEEQEVVYNGERVEDQRLIDDLCKHNDAVIHLLVRKSAKVRARPVEKNLELSIVVPQLIDGGVRDVDGENYRRKYDVGGKNSDRGYEADGEILPRKPPDRDFLLENNGSCEDMGPGAFPVEEVHKICVLDIRMANADRHAGNILLSKEQVDGKTLLIPIDHGYCLPETVSTT